MGHIRLGSIPKSQPWRAVVSAVIGSELFHESNADGRTHGENGVAVAGAAGATGSRSADPYSQLDQTAIAAVAAKTLDAAEQGLNAAVNDEGLRYTFFLLTQVALASREEDWRARLSRVGIDVSPNDSLLELTSAFQLAVDDHLLSRGHPTDISEIAQRSAGEALYKLAADRAQTLFGDSGEQLRQAIRPLSTPKGFGTLGQTFFGAFLTHYLNFYLSRITAAEIGRGGIQDLHDITHFNAALSRHCEQSAAIVRDFAGEWYSKTEFQHGINERHTGGFIAVAVQKLRAELRMQQSVR